MLKLVVTSSSNLDLESGLSSEGGNPGVFHRHPRSVAVNNTAEVSEHQGASLLP